MKQPREIAIVAARRTPFGRFGGRLRGLSPIELATIAGEATLGDLGPHSRQHFEAVILGQILTTGHRNNQARQVAQCLGLEAAAAWTVDQACAAGMTAILSACRMIRTGEVLRALAGGMESMSGGRFFLDVDRHADRLLGPIEIVDGLVHDGLIDPALRIKMGELVERHPDLARFTRSQMDAYALRAQRRAEVAYSGGFLDAELAPVAIGDQVMDDDEPRRHDSTAAGLAALPPAFAPEGRITAGNSSKIADGAALVALCDPIEAIQRDLPILAVVEGWAQVAGDPWFAPLAAADAIKKLCRHLARGLCAYDWLEINEAFAVQVLGCLRLLGLEASDTRVNPDGGAIAVGHPVATSAARIVGHLAHVIDQGRARRGIAAVGVGGGMGVAISLRAP